jgi:hypothetical protein
MEFSAMLVLLVEAIGNLSALALQAIAQALLTVVVIIAAIAAAAAVALAALGRSKTAARRARDLFARLPGIRPSSSAASNPSSGR